MTLSILDINVKNKRKQLRKASLVYLILSFTAIAADKMYDLFGHGVDSPYMTWMFLYPLLGGTLLYFLINFFAPAVVKFSGYRLFLNIYNSGIATLTFGSFLKGVFEIAGTNSDYIVLYDTVGWIFAAAGLVLLAPLIINRKKVHV